MLFALKQNIKSSIRIIIEKCFPEISILHSPGRFLLSYDLYSAKCGENVNIIAPAHIYDTVIGNYTYVAQNSYISGTKIGKYCSIGPNILCGWGIHPINGISTSPMFYSTKKQNGMTLSPIDKIEERKEITIGNDVFIGANVTVLDGVTIGDGAVIGAGSVVSKDIPPYSVAVGSPIKIIKKRFSDDEIALFERIRWWNFDQEQIQDVERMFFDINAFLSKYKDYDMNTVADKRH